MTSRNAVEGERAEPRVLSVPAQLPHGARTIIAATAVTGGLVLMGWYAYHLRTAHVEDDIKAVATSRHAAASEMSLPPLEAPHARPTPVSAVVPAAPPAHTPETFAAVSGHAGAVDVDHAEAPTYAPTQTSSVTAPVLVRADGDVGSSEPRTLERGAIGSSEPEASGAAAIADATLLPDRRWLLQKGSFLDCTLETAIDSTLPGLATCVLATDVYGADGRVVLMERGTRLVGDVRGDVRAGQNRVAVTWSDARTTAGVRLIFQSMATDQLGRTGLPGVVDRHLGERFGAAVLLSFVDGAAGALTAREQSRGAVVYNAQGSRDIATEALRGSIGIPPTIRVAPGTRIQVIVASDVNFRNVYRLSARAP